MRTLIYCGKKSDLELIKNNEMDIIYFDSNNNMIEYFSLLPAKEKRTFYGYIEGYQKYYLDSILPKIEALKDKEVMVAGDLNHWNLLIIAKAVLSSCADVTGCFIEPEHFESSIRHVMAEDFLMDHMGPSASGSPEFKRLRVISMTRDNVRDGITLEEFNKYRYEQMFYYMNNYDDILKGSLPVKYDLPCPVVS